MRTYLFKEKMEIIMISANNTKQAKEMMAALYPKAKLIHIHEELLTSRIDIINLLKSN